MLLVSAGILVFLVKVHPFLLSDNVTKATANHIFLHQIAGTVVPENDSQLIPASWYEEGKGFEDVKEMYAIHPTFADPFNVFWEPHDSNRPFKKEALDKLKSVWLKAIFTYPVNWVDHVSRFYKKMWFQEPSMILDANQIQAPPRNNWHIKVASNFPENERHIVFTPLQKKIYTLLFNNKFLLNHIVGVSLGFFVFVVGVLIWLLSPSLRHPILLFAISTSLSSFCTANIVCVFSPATLSRYMSPVLVLSLVGLIGFITWSYLVLSRSPMTEPGKI